MDDIATYSGTIPVYFVYFPLLFRRSKKRSCVLVCLSLGRWSLQSVALNTRVQTNGC